MSLTMEKKGGNSDWIGARIQNGESEAACSAQAGVGTSSLLDETCVEQILLFLYPKSNGKGIQHLTSEACNENSSVQIRQGMQYEKRDIILYIKKVGNTMLTRVFLFDALSHFLWLKPNREQSEQKWESQEPLTSTVDLISILSSLSGQENPLNSSHLCQKLWCLSSQTQGAPALPACTGGPLVLPMVWVSAQLTAECCYFRGICSVFRLILPWSLQCPMPKTQREPCPKGPLPPCQERGGAPGAGWR